MGSTWFNGFLSGLDVSNHQSRSGNRRSGEPNILPVDVKPILPSCFHPFFHNSPIINYSALLFPLVLPPFYHHQTSEVSLVFPSFLIPSGNPSFLIPSGNQTWLAGKFEILHVVRWFSQRQKPPSSSVISQRTKGAAPSPYPSSTPTAIASWQQCHLWKQSTGVPNIWSPLSSMDWCCETLEKPTDFDLENPWHLPSGERLQFAMERSTIFNG